MYFDTLSAALQMEGHGIFVWSAYVITALVLVWLLLSPRVRRRRFVARLAAEQRRNQGFNPTEAEGSNAPGS